MKNIFFVVITFFFYWTTPALVGQISKNTQLSLITCGSGEELYSSFGHSALWFYDRSTGLDRIYNYGTFDFNTPNFYSKFVQGRLPYALDVSNMNNFMQTYYYEQRLVKQQVLALDSMQKKKIFDYLENNLLPENKYYHYDFFYDNCSTRLRDLLEKCTDNQISWQNDQENAISMRQLLNPGVKNMPWTTFGFYLTLGNVTDQEATTRTKMFLPDHLFEAINAATLAGKPLVNITKPIFVPENPSVVKPSPITPIVVFTILLIGIVIVTAYEIKTGRYHNWVDNVLFVAVGMFGIFLTWLWLGTDHKATKINMNILWALPIFVLFPLISKRIKLQEIEKWIVGVSLVILILVFFSFALIQEFHVAARIIMLILIIRLFKKLYLNYKLQKSDV